MEHSDGHAGLFNLMHFAYFQSVSLNYITENTESHCYLLSFSLPFPYVKLHCVEVSQLYIKRNL